MDEALLLHQFQREVFQRLPNNPELAQFGAHSAARSMPPAIARHFLDATIWPLFCEEQAVLFLTLQSTEIWGQVAALGQYCELCRLLTGIGEIRFICAESLIEAKYRPHCNGWTFFFNKPSER